MADVLVPVPLSGGRMALLLGWTLDPPWRLKGEGALPFLFIIKDVWKQSGSIIVGLCLFRLIVAFARPPVGASFTRTGKNFLYRGEKNDHQH